MTRISDMDIVTALENGIPAYVPAEIGSARNVRFDIEPAVRAKLPGFPSIIKNLGDALPYVNPSEFFGIKSDGSNNDDTAWNNANTAITNNSKGPGGILRFPPGAITLTSSEKVIKPNVRIDLQGGKIEAHLAGGNDCAVTPMTCSAIENGAIYVVSTGSPGNQAGAHAPIRVGPTYGAGTPASPDPLEGAYGWVIRNLVLSTDKLITDATYPLGDGAPGIQVYGSAHHGLIENITIPDSPNMVGGVMLDWTPQGPIVSLVAQMTANKTLYNTIDGSGNRSGRTLHPHNIDIRNVKVGVLSRVPDNPFTGSGSFGVRASGCQHLTFRNIMIEKVMTAAIWVTAGDLGFEFAEPEVRRLGMPGIIFDNVTVRQALVGTAAGGGAGGYLAYLDSTADNVATAMLDAGHGGISYSNMISPLVDSGILLNGVSGQGDASANAQMGIRCTQLSGAEITRCVSKYFNRGIVVDDSTKTVRITKNIITNNRSHGIEINHSNYPQDIDVSENTINSNGTAGTAAGVLVGTSKGVRVWGNIFGIDGAFDPTQAWGIRADGAMIALEIGVPARNVHLSTVSGGVAESILSTDVADYRKIAAYRGGEMRGTAFITTPRAGLDLVPEVTRTDSDGVTRSHFVASATAAPSSVPAVGTFYAGETLICETTGLRKRNTASGTQGTLNGGATTGSITSGTKLLTVNSATGLLPGAMITIAGVAGVKTVVSINSLVVTIDTNANATVAAAAIAFSAGTWT